MKEIYQRTATTHAYSIKLWKVVRNFQFGGHFRTVHIFYTPCIHGIEENVVFSSPVLFSSMQKDRAKT